MVANIEVYGKATTSQRFTFIRSYLFSACVLNLELFYSKLNKTVIVSNVKTTFVGAPVT